MTGPGRFVEGLARPRRWRLTSRTDAVRDRGGVHVVVTDIGCEPGLAREVHGPVSVRGNLTGPRPPQECGRSGSACRSSGAPGAPGSPRRGHDGGQRLCTPAARPALVLGVARCRGAPAARPERGVGRGRTRPGATPAPCEARLPQGPARGLTAPARPASAEPAEPA